VLIENHVELFRKAGLLTKQHQLRGTRKRQSTPAYVEVSLVESVDGLLSAAGHGHESKAPGPAALAILHTGNRRADVNIKNVADYQ
jgi:hypothetical protein